MAASVYELEPDAEIGATIGGENVVFHFDKKGLHSAAKVEHQMFLDSLVTDDSHALKLAEGKE